MKITLEDKMRAAAREVSFRKQVYPRLITQGKMTEFAATRHIMLMQAIVDDYAELIQKQSRAQASLFETSAETGAGEKPS